MYNYITLKCLVINLIVLCLIINRLYSSKTEVEKKRKKKRKIILPKNFNPEVPPNPERWLPRHERTGYRKKKDRRNKETGVGKGTQGASNVSSEQL